MPPVLLARRVAIEEPLFAVMITLVVGNTRYVPAGITVPALAAVSDTLEKYAPAVLVVAFARMILFIAKAMSFSPYSER
jgi:hypothetical protein